MTNSVYTRELLRLATQIPNLGRLDNPGGSAEQRAKTCGSKVIADVKLDENGGVTDFAWEIHACAFGQASAAILGPHLMGMTGRDIITATQRIEAILAGEDRRDDAFLAIEHLYVARDHSARHPAILLPYHAISAAIENALSLVSAA